MLLSFSVANFRSFRVEQSLSTLASKRLGPCAGSAHVYPLPGTQEHALRVAALYGANAAGKSNVVRACLALQRLVCEGTDPGDEMPRDPFLLDDSSRNEPTSFEVQFVQDGTVFRYGACFDAQRVHEEWLSAYEGKKERSLFARTSTDTGDTTVELGPAATGESSTTKLRSLAEVAARPNQLFLNEVRNLDNPQAQGVRLHCVIQWFTSTLKVIPPGAAFVSLIEKVASEEEFARFASEFLRDASTGISSLETESLEIPKSQFPPAVLDTLEGERHDRYLPAPLPVGWEFVKETGGDTVKIRRIVASHVDEERRTVQLPLNKESDGSQRLLHLLPALYQLAKHPRVYVVDELERSMHPMLARKFVEFFVKAGDGSNSQLIFTTHESGLLDLDLIRRDGIWFAEKDRDGATHLYSLADFKVRNDLRIDKGYLQGRFGAVPFLNGLDRLIERQTSTEAAR